MKKIICLLFTALAVVKNYLISLILELILQIIMHHSFQNGYHGARTL